MLRDSAFLLQTHAVGHKAPMGHFHILLLAIRIWPIKTNDPRTVGFQNPCNIDQLQPFGICCSSGHFVCTAFVVRLFFTLLGTCVISGATWMTIFGTIQKICQYVDVGKTQFHLMGTTVSDVIQNHLYVLAIAMAGIMVIVNMFSIITGIAIIVGIAIIILMTLAKFAFLQADVGHGCQKCRIRITVQKVFFV